MNLIFTIYVRKIPSFNDHFSFFRNIVPQKLRPLNQDEVDLELTQKRIPKKMILRKNCIYVFSITFIFNDTFMKNTFFFVRFQNRKLEK